MLKEKLRVSTLKEKHFYTLRDMYSGCDTLEWGEDHILCECGELDEAKDVVRELWGKYSHFTVRKGKAVYHMLHLPDYSCGLYYAVRVNGQYLEGRRALPPQTKLKVWPKQNKELH
jgi:hypothetical protein